MAKSSMRVNPEMVTLARESQGLTQPELANKLSISQALLSRIEAGLRSVDEDLLNKLANELSFQPNFFQQKETIFGLGYSGLYHRKLQSMETKELKRIHAQINIFSIAFKRLLSGVELGVLKIKPMDMESFGSPSDIAKFVRADWNLPLGTISNVVSILENAGAILIPFDFHSAKIDAIASWRPDLPPMFFLNMSVPTDRLRFTLCHELGHVILHKGLTDIDMTEHDANEFAAEFLMPEKEIKHQLIDVNIDKLMLLKQQWKVSMAALLKRAETLNTITPRKARSLWMTMGKMGYRIHEPEELDLPHETPSLFKEIVMTYFDDLDFSINELSNLIFWQEYKTESLLLCPSSINKTRIENKSTIKDIEDYLNNHS